MGFIPIGKSEAGPRYLLPGLRLVRLMLLMPLEVLTAYTTIFFPASGLDGSHTDTAHQVGS